MTHEEPQQNRYLLPPGAKSKQLFLNNCSLCYACVSVCPHESIRVCHDANSDLNGYPVIQPQIQSCFICSDFPCVTVCQDGALDRDWVQKPLGYAKINPESCFAYHHSICQSCISSCPRSGVAISRGTNGYPVINVENCYGCGICQNVCPANPAGIYIQISTAS